MKVNYYRIISDALRDAVVGTATNLDAPLSDDVMDQLVEGIDNRFWCDLDAILTFPDFHKED
jgi:hypothetical protein